MIFFGIESAFQFVLILISVSIFLSSLEYLARRGDFSSSSLVPWTVMSARSPIFQQKMIAKVFDVIFSDTSVFVILIIRSSLSILFAISVWVEPFSLTSVVCCSMLLLLSIAMVVRSPFGHEGSDQMIILILLSFLIGELVSSTTISREIVLSYIAAQSVLAYMTTGVAKFISPVWRNGTALVGIMSADSYGNRVVARIVEDHSVISKFSCWIIIGFQILFPIGVLLGGEWLVLTLISGMLFHLLVALFMGLNCFFWAFMAPYAAIIYIRGIL